MKTIKLRGISDDGILTYPNERLFGGLNNGDILQSFSNVEQFTGLQDKNGKDIYEGDLVKNKSGRICEVYWHENAATWDYRVIKAVGDSRGFRNANTYFMIEIIGNIHKNPKLLK